VDLVVQVEVVLVVRVPVVLLADRVVLVVQVLVVLVVVSVVLVAVVRVVALVALVDRVVPVAVVLVAVALVVAVTVNAVRQRRSHVLVVVKTSMKCCHRQPRRIRKATHQFLKVLSLSNVVLRRKSLHRS
jgi:steroid 5-alpha reductase family enzyme